MLSGPTPVWVSIHKTYLLYKFQGLFSQCKQSHDQKMFFLGGTSLCFTDQETQKENMLGGSTPLRVSTYTSYLLYKVQDPFRPCRQFPSQSIYFNFFSGKTSLCFKDQETQEENMLGGPTPLWISIYTSYLLYKVQDPFSPCRQFPGQSIYFKVF